MEDLTFKSCVKKYIIEHNLFDFKNSNIKYSLDTILNGIEGILKTGMSWRDYDLPIFDKIDIKWKSIYYHHQKFIKNNVYKNSYIELLKKYMEKRVFCKLKFISCDTSYIKNAYGKQAKYNPHMGKKKTYKLSTMVDINGVLLSACVDSGNKSDQEYFYKNIQELLVDIKAPSNNNVKYKRYFGADSIYDTTEIRDAIISYNIKPIIPFNKRNTKDPIILKEKELNKKEKKIYKKRMIIENSYSWLFKFKRLSIMSDKNISTYLGFLYMTYINIINRRMHL
jgi:transposase